MAVKQSIQSLPAAFQQSPLSDDENNNLYISAARCPAHPTVLHTTVVILDTQRDGPEVVSFGEKVIYTCNHGYMEASGSSMRECLADGSYSGKNLVCTGTTIKPFCPQQRAILFVMEFKVVNNQNHFTNQNQSRPILFIMGKFTI